MEMVQRNVDSRREDKGEFFCNLHSFSVGRDIFRYELESTIRTIDGQSFAVTFKWTGKEVILFLGIDVTCGGGRISPFTSRNEAKTDHSNDCHKLDKFHGVQQFLGHCN